MRDYLYVLITALCLPLIGSGQTISEDFNHDKKSISEEDCWEFDDVKVDDPNAPNTINTGVDLPLAEADVDGGNDEEASLYSPYLNFDGTGSITFKHRLDDDDPAKNDSSQIQIYLVDPAGVRTGPVFTHVYRNAPGPGGTPNGDPLITQLDTVAINWSGYYRVQFYWDANNHDGKGQLDDISIDGVLAADTLDEKNGYCPCIINLTDTVCAVTLDDPREAMFSRAGREYTWSWTGPSGGTVDLSISTSDSIVEVDWGTTSGTYILHSKEDKDGDDKGNETNYIIFVSPPPTYTYSTDTVCPDDAPALTLAPSGLGPFTVTYDDGNGVQSVSVPGASAVVLLSNGAANVNIISVTDGNGCSVDPATLGVQTIPYLPVISTGAIYH